MKVHGTIKINGVDYAIRYGTSVLQRMEDQDGIFLDKIGENVSIGMIAKMFYHGLKAFYPTLTKEQAGDLMDEYFEEGGNLQQLAEIIVNAINKSMGLKPQQKQSQAIQQENLPK